MRFARVPYRRHSDGVLVREDDEQHHLDDKHHSPAPSGLRTMLAKYRGVCVATGAKIAPGDTITHTRGVGSTLVARAQPEGDVKYVSDVIRTSGGTFFRNKRGLCEDAPACGCCTI